jgi:hypothetical protein
MKTIKNITIMLLAAGTVMSCSKNEDNPINNLPEGFALKADARVKVGDLPQAILDYVTENYKELTIAKSEEEDNGNFEIKLSNGTELIFDAEGNFLGVDDDDENGNFDDSDIPVEELLASIIMYVEENYPMISIKEASMENNGHYEITLGDKTVLIFDANGEFLGVGVDENDQDGDGEYEWGDGDHHDDGDSIDPAQLPENVLTYLADTYPDLTIMHAEVESEGYYEVTMSNGLEVYFDAEGNFVSTDEGEDHED